MQAAPFLFNPVNHQLIDKSGPGTLAYPRKSWLILFVLAVLVPWPWIGWSQPPPWLPAGLQRFYIVLAIGGLVANPIAIVAFPVVLFITVRRRLLLRGRLMRGLARCERAALVGTDDHTLQAIFALEFVYRLDLPDGRQIRGIQTEQAKGDYEKYRQTPPELVWERFPKLGDRVPIAILYQDPHLYRVL